MDYEAFKALVRDMRAAQRNKPFLHISGSVTVEKLKKFHSEHEDYFKRLRDLERRVDEEIAAAERQELANDPDGIRMANGQTLRQGNLFEDQ